jgi:pyridoxal 5'-phosphate synthase pdxT subunit
MSSCRSVGGEVKLGVLALQGDFGKHLQMLRALGVEAVEVRKADELELCDGLVMPGGESTAMLRLMKESDFGKKLHDFGQCHPVFGTCAGLILMAKEIVADVRQPFGWLDVSVERNAFGRQVESFQAEIPIQLEGRHRSLFPALFIRAPRIRRCSSDVEVLATYQEEPVLVKQGYYLGATFHPELTENSSIHSFFIHMVKKHCKN